MVAGRHFVVLGRVVLGLAVVALVGREPMGFAAAIEVGEKCRYYWASWCRMRRPDEVARLTAWRGRPRGCGVASGVTTTQRTRSTEGSDDAAHEVNRRFRRRSARGQQKVPTAQRTTSRERFDGVTGCGNGRHAGAGATRKRGGPQAHPDG